MSTPFAAPAAAGLSRRQFLQNSLAVAGAATWGGSPALGVVPGGRRTAVDQVVLGNTGIRLSRLGMGTGSNSGNVQHALGREGFRDLVHYAYDQGITWFDCSQTYRTFEWMADALKGLPRDKVFLQTKIPGQPENVLQAIDRHRQVYQTDYLDSLLIHCMVQKGWTEGWKRIMDGFETAKEKGWVRSKGVSCHSLPALRAATASPWVEVHLVRVNPQGWRMDGEEESVWNDAVHEVAPVVAQLREMRAKGRGVIGMKIMGNGEFTREDEREKSVRFAMAQPEIDAVVVGFKDRREIDACLRLMNRALAEG